MGCAAQHDTQSTGGIVANAVSLPSVFGQMGEVKRMDPEIKAKWLEALRSGEFKQGQNVLRTAEDGYCCLGVLCELAVREGVIGDPKFQIIDGSPSASGPSWEYDGLSVYPSDQVYEWAGMSSILVELNGRLLSLDYLNDALRLPFSQIADLIEEQL